MTKLIHCPHCQEDINEADWEANASCCPGCGNAVELPDAWMHHERGFAAFRERMEWRSLFNRGTPVSRSATKMRFQPVIAARRVYA